MTTKRIAVTGGAGFIGSHLVDRLLEQGHWVTCIDNFDTFYDPAVKRENVSGAMQHERFILVEGDIRDANLLLETFKRNAIDTVVHLAARAGVRPSILHPKLYYDVNVTGTLCMLEAMREAGIKRMIFASSSSVYGNNPQVPFSETDPVDNPISPYAATKKAGELLCHTYHHLHGFDTYCLRFFTVYGPRQRPEMAIHSFVNRILKDEAITLFGNGTSARDYTYIDDIIDGVMSSIERVKGYEVINLGEARTTSLMKLVSLIESQLGRKARIHWEPKQSGDVEQTYADIRKAHRLLGYEPQFSMLAGIREFCRWRLASDSSRKVALRQVV